jgi:type IV pilus assembly protein PilW
MQLLQREIGHAGFWDGYIPEFDDLTFKGAPAVPDAVPDPCRPYASWPGTETPPLNSDKNLLGIAVQVHDSVPSGCTSLLTGWKSGTDILVVRHAKTCIAGTAGCEAVVDGKLYLQVSRARGGSCATAIKTESAFALNTNTSFALHKRDCSLLTEKRRYVQSIYYVRDYSISAGDGIPTLMRSEFDRDPNDGAVKAMAPVALIEGVEGFRVDLGIDSVSDAGVNVISDNGWKGAVEWADVKHLTSPVNRGDGVPDEFVHCSGVCTVAQLANVTTVKVSLLVRGQTATPGYKDTKSYTLGSQAIAAANDGFKRHAFSMDVRLTNISARRETP